MESSAAQQVGSAAWHVRHRPLVPVVISFGVAAILAERSGDSLVWGSVLSVLLAGLCAGGHCEGRLSSPRARC